MIDINSATGIEMIEINFATGVRMVEIGSMTGSRNGRHQFCNRGIISYATGVRMVDISYVTGSRKGRYQFCDWGIISSTTGEKSYQHQLCEWSYKAIIKSTVGSKNIINFAVKNKSMTSTLRLG